MTLLGIVKSFCGLKGLPIPTTVMTNTDPSVVQIREILQRFPDDMMIRTTQRAGLAQANFTTNDAQEDQGSIHTIAPLGYLGIAPDTFFDSTTQLLVTGGMTSTEWGWQHARINAGPLFRYDVRGSRLYLSPKPPAGHPCFFEYYSSFYIQSSAGARQALFQADTDTTIFHDALPKAFLRWAYKAERGLDYAEDFATYEKLILSLVNKQGLGRVLTMDGHGAERAPGPGIVIPPGSWNL
jgi:hypothetical protein